MQPPEALAPRAAIDTDALALCARVCVSCGAAHGLRPAYREQTAQLGRLLARAGIEIVYGGGASGLMGVLADAALAQGGRVHGIRPRNLRNVEAEHRALTSMRHTKDLGSRKRLMWSGARAIVVLPGGTGTFDELLEAITQKRLSLHALPVIVIDVDAYFEGFFRFVDHGIAEGFVGESQRSLWQAVRSADEALPFIVAAMRAS